MPRTMLSATCRFGSAALVAAALTGQAHAAAKNVILMISDGQGFNQMLAAEYYTKKAPVYYGFDVKLGMQTFSYDNAAYQSALLGGDPDALLKGYDPQAMATNLTYVSIDPTDSASAATAMYTGKKIHDGDINMTPEQQQKAITTFFEKAAKTGKAMGAVSSVQITHATPGAVYGHNVSRNNYAQIGAEGVTGSNPSANNDFYDALNYNGNFRVLMGAGHGDYDNDGNYKPGASDSYAGGTALWNDIKDGAAPNGWTFVDEKATFEDIAAGNNVPDKLLGIAQVNTTLQQGRSVNNNWNTEVPTLATMTSAALNVLGQDEDGFTVMIEGGAVDWAGHANQIGRTIEEQIDFNNSVKAAVDWVEANSNWEETLLIVTADHETGWLMGGDNPVSFFDVNGNGAYDHGVDYSHLAPAATASEPDVSWFSGGHTNQLVPLFAKGAGSELLYNYIINNDPNLADYYGVSKADWNGDYIDNTSIYSVMMEASNVPEPASLALLALGAVALLRRR